MLRQDKGFSLFELMATLAIIGILVSISLASYWYTTSKTHRIACESNRRVLDGSIEMYRIDHDGSAPADIDALAPYTRNFSLVVDCPGEPDTRLRYDGNENHIVCDFHTD
jgi:prepilin-type N-terminal cleavage/methylation domain-containing protein